VPTIQEAGFNIPNVPQVRGIVAPPGIPPEAVAYWEDLFGRFVKTESWKKYLEDNLFEDGFQRSAELNKFIDEYSEITRGVLREGGVKVVR
jgi:putative tricarboxylic transport membrane protein